MKQVIVVNQSLKLPCGKLAAQVAHAAVAAYLAAHNEQKSVWLKQGMPKIVVSVESETQLLEIAENAMKNNVPTRVIRDAGKTVVEKGTVTCLGLGPAEEDSIDALTGDLPLLA